MDQPADQGEAGSSIAGVHILGQTAGCECTAAEASLGRQVKQEVEMTALAELGMAVAVRAEIVVGRDGTRTRVIVDIVRMPGGYAESSEAHISVQEESVQACIEEETNC